MCLQKPSYDYVGHFIAVLDLQNGFTMLHMEKLDELKEEHFTDGEYLEISNYLKRKYETFTFAKNVEFNPKVVSKEMYLGCIDRYSNDLRCFTEGAVFKWDWEDWEYHLKHIIEWDY